MYTNSDFINDSIAVHGNVYDYSESVYLKADKLIKIICKHHGPFFQRKWNHVNRKQGCPICGGSSLLSTNSVIIRLKEIFGDMYDYSKVEYKNTKTKILLICNRCRCEFSVIPSNVFHTKSAPCPVCDGHTKVTTDTFIKRAKNIHDNKFDYSNTTYIDSETCVLIKCNECNKQFYQLPLVHLRSTSCPKCCGRQMTLDEFIEQGNNIHNFKYDYSNVVLGGWNVKVKIYCNDCEKYFYQTPNRHIRKQSGCPFCIGRNKTTEEFVDACKNIFGDLLDFANVVFKTNRQKVNITCNKCKTNYNVRASDLLAGKGCPICKESKGEREIRKFLLRSNLKFSRQFKFDDCFSVNRLPFDFVVFNVDGSIKFLIEYQGHQHYRPVRFGGISIEQAQKNFESCVIRDKIKIEYCENNNIKLVIIKYTEIKNISDILKDA
jgi:hypothetical protein